MISNRERVPRATLISLRSLAAISCLFTSVVFAAVDVPLLQQRLSQGQAAKVRAELERELAKQPENPHLLYNRAITAYAEGRFEEALLDLDVVENARSKSLVAKARFQKGNADFRLGLNARTNDLDVAISRWKQSIANYDALLKDNPKHADALKNREQARKLLLDTLLKRAQENLQKGQQQPQPAEQRIQKLRNAMEQFHDAKEMKPEGQQAQEAKEGEEKSKDLLAKALAEEGTRKTLANNMVMPKPNQPMVMQPNVPEIQEGVNMLEDASALKPEDKNIAQQLDAGRERLANALAMQALTYKNIEPQIPRMDDKLGLLRMGMELTEKALEQKPNHQMAKEVQEQIKQRLAQLHEQRGDELNQQSENAELDQQAQQLSEALDHFQQASELQPQQKQLPQKAQKAQQKLEQALEQLGDKLMKKPGGEESPEGEVTRLEGAEQALNELQSLKPSEKTAKKAQQVGEQLGEARQKMAKKSKQPGGKDEEETGQGESGKKPGGPPQNNLQSMPMDAPPRLDTPGVKGPYQSPAMNRNLRDY
jgi:tetratricopeptide (TPR) repeat protein